MSTVLLMETTGLSSKGWRICHQLFGNFSIIRIIFFLLIRVGEIYQMALLHHHLLHCRGHLEMREKMRTLHWKILQHIHQEHCQKNKINIARKLYDNVRKKKEIDRGRYLL